MASVSIIKLYVFISATLALHTTSLAINLLYSGDTLGGGQSIIYGSYSLTMQTDCNLVLYDNGHAIWWSGTSNIAANCFLSVQFYGNIVIYSGRNEAVWSSSANGAYANYVLVLQRDGDLVVYGPVVWASGTVTN